MSTSAESLGGADEGFVLAVRSLDDPDVARMIDELQAEYQRRYGGQDQAPTAVAEFAAPNGTFLVGMLDGDVVAMGGWRRRPDGAAEIKRLYVADRSRRRGLAQAVLTELERTAAQAGAPRMVLSTGNRQPEAVALYRRRGYTPLPGWGHYADDPNEIFLGRPLP